MADPKLVVHIAIRNADVGEHEVGVKESLDEVLRDLANNRSVVNAGRLPVRILGRRLDDVFVDDIEIK